MKKSLIRLAVIGGIVGLFWIWSHPHLSPQHTIDFAVQYQDLLNEYVALSRSHSPEAENVWNQIRQCGYFTSVDCWFDRNGAIQVHFSVPDGGIKEHEEGYYQICYCLLWQDSDYDRHVEHLEWWNILGEEDGIAISQTGNWYWTSHKHWLDG